MKKRLIHLSILAFFLALFLFPASLSHGQSEAQAGDGLMIEHQEDGTKSVILKNGTKLRVLTTDGQVQKGELNGVTDSSFVLGSKGIAFSKTEKIKVVKGEGSVLGGIAGIILGVLGAILGLAIGYLGQVLIDDADGSADGCAAIFFGVMLLVLGIAIGVIGIIFLIVGLIAFAVGKAAGRSFRFDKQWRLKRNAKP